MAEIHDLVEGLLSKDNQHAYGCLKQLEEESRHSTAVYSFFANFSSMLDSKNSYIRARGIILIAANAKWDTDYKIDEIIDKYLQHILDDKPITARQCIKSLPLLVKYKPELKDPVINALRTANPLIYQETMQELIRKDIQKSLAAIGQL